MKKRCWNCGNIDDNKRITMMTFIGDNYFMVWCIRLGMYKDESSTCDKWKPRKGKREK